MRGVSAGLKKGQGRSQGKGKLKQPECSNSKRSHAERGGEKGIEVLFPGGHNQTRGPR